MGSLFLSLLVALNPISSVAGGVVRGLKRHQRAMSELTCNMDKLKETEEIKINIPVA